MKKSQISSRGIILLGIIFLFTTTVKGQGATYVGIPSGSMNYFAASQTQSQWCWAASIKMVLNYYGVAIEQEDIVERTYGRDPYGKLPNWPGTFQSIHRNLNNWGIDDFGYPYMVKASIGMGAPSPSYLINELSYGRPVIIGYRPPGGSGHAVVVTAVSYIPTYNGPYIQSIVVRDPWPSRSNIQTRGRVEYPGATLASKIDAYWYVRVMK